MQKFELENAEATAVKLLEKTYIKRTVGWKYHSSEGLGHIPSEYRGTSKDSCITDNMGKAPEIRTYKEHHDIGFSFIALGQRAAGGRTRVGNN